MVPILHYVMVYAGSALMVYNIYRYVVFARHLRAEGGWEKEQRLLLIPIILLAMFLIGYLAVGVFGQPDLVVSAILFGGSLFVLAMILFIQLIASRIQEHGKLAAELAAAEESNRAKTNFLSTMSHEMRTPLSGIITLNKMVLKEPDLSDSVRAKSEKIGESANHLLGLVEDVLEIGRADAKGESLNIELFSLSDLVVHLSWDYDMRCQKKLLEYSSFVTSGLHDWYRGDVEKLKLVLTNVLDNAVKFTDSPGAVSLRVDEMASFEGYRTLRFTVSDTGIGMSEDFVSKAFDAFSQENASRSRSYGGSGLGLPIAKRNVEMMNGDISLTSEKGYGTKVVITVTLEVSDELPAPIEESPDFTQAAEILQSVEDGTVAETVAASGETAPAKAAEDAGQAVSEGESDDSAVSDDASAEGGLESEDEAKSETEEGEEPPDWSGVLAGLRILMAEDVDLNAEILEDLLDLEDMESERAENGQVCVDMFSRSESGYFAAILMDVRMPVMDGLDAARAIRALDRPDARTIPIIALSANAFEEDVQRSLQAGMDAHLMKPVDPDLLYEMLAEKVG